MSDIADIDKSLKDAIRLRDKRKERQIEDFADDSDKNLVLAKIGNDTVAFTV